MENAIDRACRLLLRSGAECARVLIRGMLLPALVAAVARFVPSDHQIGILFSIGLRLRLAELRNAASIAGS